MHFLYFCSHSLRVTILRNLKCLKPGLRCFYYFKADPQIFLQPSYASIGGVNKSLYPLIKTTYLLHMCDIDVPVGYLYDKYSINVTYMWHHCTYMYSICWIRNYVGNVCDIYIYFWQGSTASLLQFNILLTWYVFSVFYILQGANAYDLRQISSKMFFPEVNKCYLYTEMNWCLQLH